MQCWVQLSNIKFINYIYIINKYNPSHCVYTSTTAAIFVHSSVLDKDKYTEIKLKGHLLSNNTYNYFDTELILHINVQVGAASQARENVSYIQDWNNQSNHYTTHYLPKKEPSNWPQTDLGSEHTALLL